MLEDDGLEGFVVVVAADAGDFFHDVHAVDDFAEHGMAVIEVGGVNFGDEELGAVCVGAGVCHGEDAGSVVAEFGIEFIAEAIAGAACADAEGAAALDHEFGDDAVEDEAIVEGFIFVVAGHGVDGFDLASGESDEVFDGIGGECFCKFADDIAEGCFETGIELAVSGDVDFGETGFEFFSWHDLFSPGYGVIAVKRKPALKRGLTHMIGIGRDEGGADFPAGHGEKNIIFRVIRLINYADFVVCPKVRGILFAQKYCAGV